MLLDMIDVHLLRSAATVICVKKLFVVLFVDILPQCGQLRLG